MIILLTAIPWINVGLGFRFGCGLEVRLAPECYKRAGMIYIAIASKSMMLAETVCLRTGGKRVIGLLPPV